MTRAHLLLPVLAALVAPSLVPSFADAQDFDGGGEQAMLARINAMRAAQQLTPLVRHPGLDAAARAHSVDMAHQQALTHVSDSSGTPADRVRAAGVRASSVSENVALHRDAGAAHEALIGSDAHRANMMAADATHVGLAALRTEQGVYVTQVFASMGAPAPVAEAPPAPAPAPPDIQPALPAPSTELVDEPASGGTIAAPMPPPAMPPPAATTQARRPMGQPQLEVQPGSNGTVVIARDGARVLAYWVYGSGRWWYYPYPANAVPGQQLQVDMSVEGPPPGFPAHPNGVGPSQFGAMAAPPARPMAPPPPPPGRRMVVRPYAGSVQVNPGTVYYAVPPPPLVGRPTRAWRRAYRVWQRDRRRWDRQQRILRRRSL